GWELGLGARSPSTRHLAPADRVHAAARDRLRRGGRGEEEDQRAAAGRVRGARSGGDGENGDPLHSWRKRPDDVDAADRAQLADLLEAELRVASGDGRRDRLVFDLAALRGHLTSDAEPLEQLGR